MVITSVPAPAPSDRSAFYAAVMQVPQGTVDLAHLPIDQVPIKIELSLPSDYYIVRKPTAPVAAPLYPSRAPVIQPTVFISAPTMPAAQTFVSAPAMPAAQTFISAP